MSQSLYLFFMNLFWNILEISFLFLSRDIFGWRKGMVFIWDVNKLLMFSSLWFHSFNHYSLLILLMCITFYQQYILLRFPKVIPLMYRKSCILEIVSRDDLEVDNGFLISVFFLHSFSLIHLFSLESFLFHSFVYVIPMLCF